MKNKIIYLEEKNYKVLGFDENVIIASSKRHENFDSLLASAEKSGMLETVRKIDMTSLNALQFGEENQVLKFEYIKPNGSSKKTSFNFSIAGTMGKVAAAIGDLKGFQKSEVKESATKPLLLNILGLLMTIAGTYGFVWMANESASGVAYDGSGRYAHRNEAVYDMIGKIPSEIIILIGVGTFCWLSYTTWQRYKNPHTVTRFSK